MQSKQKQPVEKVVKPFLRGSFCGKDAWKRVPGRMLAVLGISLLYFIGCVLVSFDSLIGRLIPALLLVCLAIYYQILRGMGQGTADVGYGEMMAERQKEGKEIAPEDLARCFHPLKGFFEAFMGALPFVIVCLIFAFMTGPVQYTLSVLPSWTEDLMQQSEFGDALRYYGTNTGLSLMDILRVACRAMTMPVVNIASLIGSDAILLVERLSPLLVLVTPLCYGIGYLMGPAQRIRINTGIKAGDDKKLRKERKARKQRQRSSAPERLI